MNAQEQEWVSGFEGKTEAEILTARLPEGISDEESFRFRDLQEEAGRKAREQALLQQAVKDLAGAERLQPRGGAGEETFEFGESGASCLALPGDSRIPFAIPEGKTDALLDRQIASCAGIIEHLARYIGRYDTAAEICNQFMDRISTMMKSSTEAALAVGRLRGMAPEGRGGGAERKLCDLTSSIKMLRPEDIWQPLMVAPLGNRNRLTHGGQTGAVKELRRLMAQWRRQTAALLARAACELAAQRTPATLPSQGAQNIHSSTGGHSCIV